MEFLIFLLIVIFAVVSGNKQKNQKGVNKPGAIPKSAAPKPASPLESLQNLFDEAEEAFGKAAGEWTEPPPAQASAPQKDAVPQAKAAPRAETAAIEAAIARARAERNRHRAKRPAAPAPEAASAPAAAAVMSAQGASPMDEEGCVGGSMEHIHTEGETHAEHRRHVEELHRREAEETLATQAALDLASMNVQRMRQAVIMAEILDRPKALRRRRSAV